MFSIKKKKIYKNWIKNTSFHGIPNILNTKYKFLKFIWLIIILIFSSLCLYVAIGQIVAYLNFDIITKIRVINETPALFPAVSILLIINIINYLQKPLNIGLD